MTDALLILCTCSSEQEADRIGAAVVEERLCACVTVLPPVRSIYRWQGAIERASEILLLIKTTTARFDALRERILALHSYDTPEVLAVPVADAAGKYLAWLHEQV